MASNINDFHINDSNGNHAYAKEASVSMTPLDQMICSETNQLLKALLPYLPLPMQQFLSIYTKASELSGTLRLFSGQQMQAQSAVPTDSLEVLQDLRRYCYGSTAASLDTMIQVLSMIRMASAMQDLNEP